MFATSTKAIVNKPDHLVQLILLQGNLPYWGRIARRVGVDGIGQRSLILVQATSAITDRLPAEQKSAYTDLQRALSMKKRRTAIGTAKNLALEIYESGSSPAPLAVYIHGVIPVLLTGQEITLQYGPATSLRCAVALIPDFPSDNKDSSPQDLPQAPPQKILFRTSGQVSEELLTFRGYCIDLFNVIESYFEEVGNISRMLLDRSSGRFLFQNAGQIKDLLGRSVATKIEYFQKCLADSKGLDAEEIHVARELINRNLEGILLAELGSFLTHEILSRFLGLFNIGFDVVNARSESFARFPKNLSSRWGVTEEQFSTVIDSNPLLSIIHEACVDPIELLRKPIDGLEDFKWLRGLRELLERTRFLEQEGISLAECNVFLSHRSGSDFTRHLLESFLDQPPDRIKIQTYLRNGPGEREYFAEIEWYIWACFAFASHLSGPELNDGKGLDWIIKELDLALVLQKPKVAVVREKSIDLNAVAAHVRKANIRLAPRSGVSNESRLREVAARLYTENNLHFEYDERIAESKNVATERISKWLKDTMLSVAEAYFLGWLSLFSPSAQELISHVCFVKMNRRVFLKSDIDTLLGPKANMAEIRSNLQKFPAFIDNKPVLIIGIRHVKNDPKKSFAYKSNFVFIAENLFPSVDIDKLTSRLSGSNGHFQDKKSRRVKRPISR